MALDLDALAAELDALPDWPARNARSHELLQAHGAAVAPVTFGRHSDARWYDLGNAPAGAPWNPDPGSPSKAIHAIWGSLSGQLEGFVRALAEATRGLLIREDAGGFRLVYLLERDRPEAMCNLFPDGSNRHTAVMGGAPSRASSALPAQLRLFASVHDGFGEHGTRFGVGSILPMARIAPLNADRPDLLEIYCDDVGNRIVALTARGDASIVCDWDHETDELSARTSFFDWLNTGYASHLLDLDPWEYRNGPY